jgi:undecaprenyl diphosphate synthase
MNTIKHVGLIPDGNRRWAIENSIDYRTAYKKSMEHLLKCIEWIFDMNINCLSIYLLSKENIERSREDLDAVLYAEEYFLSELLISTCQKYKCKVIHAGNCNLLTESMNNKINNILKLTNNYENHELYLLIGYNPIDEINISIKSNKQNLLNIEHLLVPKKNDVVIRTAGGSLLLSNFLPIQCGYAQVYIVDEYFNDICKGKIKSILDKASNVNMLFGK